MPTPRSVNVSIAARQSRAGWALLTDVETVCYATGFAPTVEVGTSPFAGGPAVALVSPAGEVSLLVTNLERGTAEACHADEVHDYLGYCAERQQPLAENYRRALADLLDLNRVRGPVAVEFRSLTASAADTLSVRDCQPIEITPTLDLVRAVKTDDEIQLLRRASELSDIGQAATRQAIAPGLTELEVFGQLRTAWESVAGSRVAVTGDFLSGTHRTAGVAGWPGNRPFEEGDLVIADLAPRRDGYWTDSCSTYAVGEATAAARRLHRVATNALDSAIALLRPGLRACDLDETMRAVVHADGYTYPHHSGHGIGTSVHEYPRLVPAETAVLKPGMVLLLEPGAYDPSVGGVRLEWMFLLTDTGAERISKFEHQLER